MKKKKCSKYLVAVTVGSIVGDTLVEVVASDVIAVVGVVWLQNNVQTKKKKTPKLIRSSDRV